MKRLSLFFALSILLITSCTEKKYQDTEEAVANIKDAMEEVSNQVVTQTIQLIVDGWNASDESAFKANSIDNMTRTSHGLPDTKNVAEYEEHMKVFHTGFPDFKVTIDKMTVHDRKAYIYWNITGTNTGPFMENPPTNKSIDVNGFSVWEINEDGKAVREDAYWDNSILLTQLGYKIVPPASE